MIVFELKSLAAGPNCLIELLSSRALRSTSHLIELQARINIKLRCSTAAQRTFGKARALRVCRSAEHASNTIFCKDYYELTFKTPVSISKYGKTLGTGIQGE